MTVEVKLFDDLDAVATDAGGALDRAGQPSLFDRLDWFRLTLAHCPPPGRLLVARARDGEACAWLFLAIENNRVQALVSWYSLRIGVVHYGRSPACTIAIAQVLRQRGIASLTTAPVATPFADELRKAGWRVACTPATANWWVDTKGLDWPAYWAARPSTLRNTFRRKAAAAGLDITIHRGFDAAAWDDYEAIYRASWKPSEGSPAFLKALGRQEGDAGTLRLGIARREGRAIAAQLWLVENGVATIHKLAHVEDAKALSPGTILSEAMFRHVIEQDRPIRIDFGTGDEPYKADWMDRRDTLWRVEAWNPATFTGLVGIARQLVRSLAKR